MSGEHVVQYGVGSLGERLAEVLAAAPDLQLMGAYDTDAALAGRKVGGLRVLPPPEPAQLAEDGVAVAVVSTTSRVGPVVTLSASLLRHGIAVVSTCEDLAWPRGAALDELREAARTGGAPFLATGINPGFLMDFLPVALAGASRDIRGVRVTRVLDAGVRREAFQAKVGVGLTPEAFAERAARPGFGHAGLATSARMLAAGLGLVVEQYEESSEGVPGEDGTMRGVAQSCRGLRADEPVITLTFRAVAGAEDPHDAIELDGTPPLRVRIDGGVNGDEGTCSVVLHATRAAARHRLAPGVRTMLDLAPLAPGDTFL